MTRPFFRPYEHANQVVQSTHESQKGFDQSLGIHGYIKKFAPLEIRTVLQC